MTIQTFEAFGFAEPLSRALTQCGYTTPTPIQVQALPPQLEGRDLLGMAETGSGKTATFLLPILQKIAANPVELGWKQVMTLILAPTRELAIQIDQEVASLSRNMNIRRAVVLGGVSKGPQINALKRGVHVLVATPGRLLDHVNMRSCDLSGVQTLVIDEADRMFDMGFIRDIKKIVSLIPMKRRTALFSATMPTEIRKFAYDILQDPFRVDLSTKTMVVDRIDQKVMIVRTAEKQSRLHTILADEACNASSSSRARSAAPTASPSVWRWPASALRHSTATKPRTPASARSTTSCRATFAFSLRPTSQPAVSTFRTSPMSSTSTCRSTPKPTCTASAVRPVRATGIAISLCDPSERKEIRAIERMMKQKSRSSTISAAKPCRCPNGVARQLTHRAVMARRATVVVAKAIAAADDPSRMARKSVRTMTGSYGDRPNNGPAHARNGRSDQSSPANGHVGGKAVFGVAGRQDRPAPANPHRGERRTPDRRGQNERPAEHRSGEHRPARRADEHRGGPAQSCTGTSPERQAGAKREAGNAPMKRNSERGGDSRTAWKGNDAPKFLRRDEDRGHARPGRNPNPTS